MSHAERLPEVRDLATKCVRGVSADHLHQDTSPEAIAATQRAVVAEALATLGAEATAEQVSDVVWLPVGVCKKRMDELRQQQEQGKRAA